MNKKNACAILIAMSIYLGLTPAFAILDKPPTKLGEGLKKMSAKSKVIEDESVNPLYPAKYTPSYIESIKDEYKCIGKSESFYVAVDMLKGTNGDFSRRAILGENLTKKPVKIEFKNLGQINQSYANYDALGWKRGKNLYIYINDKHTNSPAIALAALLSHEALHQDEYNSLSEETYAWTMEAAVWCELLELYPDYELNLDSLVQRENTLKKIFEKGDHTRRYIKKTVYSNQAYKDLPESSPGFEAL